MEPRALQKVTENARRRAEAIAAGLGMKVGSVVRVSDKRGTYSGPYALPETSRPYGIGEANVVVPEEIKETAEVQAVFELVEV